MLAPVLKTCLQVSCLCLCLAYVLHHHHHHHSRHQHHCNDDNDVWRCLASCRCKFCPESSNSGLGQSGRDEVQLLWWWWQWFSFRLNIIGFFLHWKCELQAQIVSGAEPSTHVCHRHNQVGEAGQGLDLQPDGQGGREHHKQACEHPKVKTFEFKHIIMSLGIPLLPSMTTVQTSRRMLKWYLTHRISR